MQNNSKSGKAQKTTALGGVLGGHANGTKHKPLIKCEEVAPRERSTCLHVTTLPNMTRSSPEGRRGRRHRQKRLQWEEDREGKGGWNRTKRTLCITEEKIEHPPPRTANTKTSS